MKTLILGSKGMLAFKLIKAFEEHEMIKLDLPELDITKREDVLNKITELMPELVINAAAYTDVDGCETKKDLAMNVNGNAVGYIAEACNKINVPLVHISTDYVFDGNRSSGYVEEDERNPINVYGQSKALGEDLLIKNTKKFFLIRTAWLYGPNGKNFVDTITRLASEKPELSVVTDQIGNPTYTGDLAEKIKEIVEKGIFGIYHVTNSGSCSWFDFAEKILEIKGMRNPINPTTSSQFKRQAKRPAYSILINRNLEKYGIPKMRPWQEALKYYLEAEKNG